MLFEYIYNILFDSSILFILPFGSIWLNDVGHVGECFIVLSGLFVKSPFMLDVLTEVASVFTIDVVLDVFACWS